MAEDPLAKWRRPGSKPAEGKETGGVVAVAPPSGIRPREYKAFVSDASRTPMLLVKPSLVKKPEASQAFPYGYLTKVICDGYGFSISLTFALPFPSGPAVVEIRGEGLLPLLDGILNGTVKSVQLFDPDRFIPPKDGDFDIEADEWRGPCVIKHISITEKNSPAENTTKH
jgi:hypothetical protein